MRALALFGACALHGAWATSPEDSTYTPMIEKITFSYGVLDPITFDGAQKFIYDLHVPKCPSGLNYHLLDLSVYIEAGAFTDHISVTAGEQFEEGDHSVNMILNEPSGIEEYNFEGLEILITVWSNAATKSSQQEVEYRIKVLPLQTDALEVDQKCLLCPAPKNYVNKKKVTCPIPNATIIGDSCTCNRGFLGRLTLDRRTRTYSGSCKKADQCNVENAKIVNGICICNEGFQGVLTHDRLNMTWTGYCTEKKETPVVTPKPYKKQGLWPCEGITPFECFDCPTCDEAGNIMEDLEKSCNIPEDFGVGGETYSEGSGYRPHLHKFDRSYRFPDGRANRIIYHTRWSHISKLNPTLRTHVCMSPICRWRIEMAFNSFANCQTLESPHGNQIVHWRNYTDFTMHTMKHIILIMEHAKADCHEVSTPTNVFTGTEVRQMFRIHGIDISTDATLRQAESVIRQAFSNYLRYPMRLLNVNIEGEPHPECPLAFDSPICAHVDCGYGQCVPKADGNSYDCLCNQCFKQGYHRGVKTCVHKDECKIVDACSPNNPCQCGGICVNCPECQGNRKYSCTCPANFEGPHCETLSCPTDWKSVDPSDEAKCGMCTPIEKNNDCDPNPCQNGGLCDLTGEGGLPGSTTMRGGEQATSEDRGRTTKGFKCNCGSQYTGERCERLRCDPGMVEHNGACEVQPPGYHPYCEDRNQEECPVIGPNGKTCEWNDGRGQCEELRSHCQPNPCLNGGRCYEDTSEATGYKCRCDRLFYSGDRCQDKIEVCETDPMGNAYQSESGPCRTGYTCHEDRGLPRGYSCVCPTCEEESKIRANADADADEENKKNYRRRLDYAPRFVQWKWDHSQALPRTMPLPDPFPTDFDPLVKRSEHCMVYQKSMHMGAEVRLNIKCPTTTGQGVCDGIAAKLDEFQTDESTIAAMEKRIQWNCIAAKITGVTEPHEEIQVANCPNMREYKFRWHFAYQECQFEKLGMRENAEWAVKISDDGVETCDDKYNEVICGNPICKALLLDIALLFRECPNSSTGQIGQLARRAKAMRNSVKSCVDPKLTNVVLRVQVGVQGVIDPLSNQEILYVQDWLRNDIIDRTGAPDDMVVVNAQPVLHVNDWQSRVPPTFNNIYSDEVQPQKGWLPTDLHAVEGHRPVATRCTGFCIVTLQPGPSLHPVDPMAGLFVTYSEPIRLGPCLQSMQCKVSLVPEHTAKGHYILNNDDFSPRTEIVTSGETLGMYPRLSLKPNTKYNVVMDEGVVVNARTGAPSPAVQYWFITHKPRDSLIKIGIAIGCESQLEYDNYASYLPDYAGAPQANLIDPIRDVVRQFREDNGQKEEEEAEKRRMHSVESEDGKPKPGFEDQIVDEESVDESSEDEYPMTERRRMLSSLLKGIEIVDDDSEHENLDETAIWAVLQHRELAEAEAGQGTSAIPIPEQRQVIPCSIKPYWWVFALFCIIPLIICFLAVCCVARAIEPWVQDIRRETIGTNMAYTRMTDGGYRSKCVEDKDSISFRLGGVVCYTPTLFVITVLISFLFGIFWGHLFFADTESTYWIGGLFGALICAMVWATFIAVMATWANPGQLPFFRDNRTVTRMKWSENQPRSKRGPPCFLDIDYAAQSYASTMVESDSKPEKVTVTVYRDVVQDGARAPSRLTIPIESSQNNAVMAFHLATLVFFAMLFLFTTLAMQMCPDTSIIYFILICILSGLINGLLGVFLFWILARKHCWHAAVSVLYRPYREIKMAKLPSIEYDEAKEFLARDIVFEEGSRIVKKIVVTPGASPARAEHVKPGMELVQIKAITPLGLGPPQVEFVGSSGEQGDAVRLLRQFEEKFRFRPNAPGTGPEDAAGQSKFVDIVLTFKHPRVQYQTPCN